MKRTFLTIYDNRDGIPIDPDDVVEAHAVNNEQIQVMLYNGYKIFLNVGFEEFQFFLVDNASDTTCWIYVSGICGKTVMFNPDYVYDVCHVNTRQSKVVFKNNKYLFIDMPVEELSERIKLIKE